MTGRWRDIARVTAELRSERRNGVRQRIYPTERTYLPNLHSPLPGARHAVCNSMDAKAHDWSGTTTYTDPDAFRVTVPDVSANLVVTGPGPVRSRLTWVNMRRLRLILVEAIRPRIAFVSLGPAPVFVSFPAHSDAPVVWNGVPMRNGMLLFHARRDRFHQRSTGTIRWGLIALARSDLAAHARALLGAELDWPQTTRILRPPSSLFADIRRLHTKACGLARTRPDMLAHREVARALEQDLLHALVNALDGAEACDGAARRQRHAAIMARFEKVLAAQSDRQLSMAALCAGTDVPERALRLCCEEFLGTQSDRLCSPAPAEPGTGGIVAQRSGDHDRCRRRPAPWLFRARALRGGLPGRVRRIAICHAAGSKSGRSRRRIAHRSASGAAVTRSADQRTVTCGRTKWQRLAEI